MKRIGLFIGMVILVILDQITKYFAIINLKGSQPFTIIPNVFQLQYLENYGAAFGILQNQRIFFVITTIITLIIIFILILRIPTHKKYKPLLYILMFISAGATGNLIDRVRFNYVVDFFYFELIDFPIFNVADCYVSVSAVMLVLLFLFYYKDEDFNFLSLKKKKTIESNENDEGSQKDE